MDDWHTTASLQGVGWKDRREQMKLGSRKSKVVSAVETQYCLCTNLCNHPSQRQKGWDHSGCKQLTTPSCCAPREDKTQHRGSMHQTPSPTGTAVVCYMNLCTIHKRGCTAAVSRLCIITVLGVCTAVIHRLHVYVRMHLVCHHLPSSSVPHAHTAII